MSPAKTTDTKKVGRPAGSSGSSSKDFRAYLALDVAFPSMSRDDKLKVISALRDAEVF